MKESSLKAESSFKAAKGSMRVGIRFWARSENGQAGTILTEGLYQVGFSFAEKGGQFFWVRGAFLYSSGIKQTRSANSRGIIRVASIIEKTIGRNMFMSMQ